MDSLSRMIGLARERGTIRGVRATSSLSVTHVFFVDDVLLFGSYDISDWSHYQSILTLFCNALGMEINVHKSCFITPGGLFGQRHTQVLPVSVL